MEPMLEIKNLTKYYGKTLGVKALSLTLHKGEIFGFIGPNGAGKSTTIRSIMQLINKTDGEIYIKGTLFNQDNIELKRIIGYLPSEIHLYDDFTVKEMLDYHGRFYQNTNNRRKELVSILELDEEKRIEDLSLGNLKKVGIVLALMHQPELLILDEPTSGLDPVIQQKFYHILLEEKKRGTTILYSTHILNEISKICDRVGVIKDGTLLNVETIQEISQKNLTYVTLTSDQIEDIISDLNLICLSKTNNTVQFKNHLSDDQLIKRLSKYTIDQILIESASLEEILLHYYK